MSAELKKAEKATMTTMATRTLISSGVIIMA
jgi:hypothetical protein